MITEKFEGEEICYDEANNKWVWDDKGYASLTGAKEAIRRHRVEEKKFKRVEAYDIRHSGYEKVIVTSIAVDRTWDGHTQCWVKYSDGRHKVDSRFLAATSKENSEKIEKIRELERQIQLLTRNVSELHKTLTPVLLPEKVEGREE